MAGITRADGLVLGSTGRAAVVAGDGIFHTLYVLEHALKAPEAAAGEYGGLQVGRGWRVQSGWRDGYAVVGRTEGKGVGLANERGQLRY